MCLLSEIKNAILVVDDEFDIALVLRKSLENAGYTVYEFTDPLLALEHFKVNSGKYALIITDMRMPKMNGIEFLTQVRTINQTVKAIIMSAVNIKELQVMPDLQIAECLRKPVKLSLLNEIVAKYITIAESGDDDNNNIEVSFYLNERV